MIRAATAAAVWMLLAQPFGAQAQTRIPPAMSAPVSDARIEARVLYERIVGHKIPIDHPALTEMETKIKAGDKLGAAAVATRQPEFINTTVRLFATKMSTREETIRAPLSDFVATIMGIVRDDLDARSMLVGNFLYRADAVLAPNARRTVTDLYISNNHYADLETQRSDLNAVLVRVDGQQIANSTTTTVAHPDPAGVITSRGFMEAHAVAGTNRRLVEFTFREFTCLAINEVADSSAPDNRIGRDIDRFPGGDQTKFATSCKSCHTVMDGFRGAFARFDFSNNVVKHGTVNQALAGNFAFVNDPAGIARKMNGNNTVYPLGYRTTDDTFVNNANQGTNAGLFGWRDGAYQKQGVKAFAELIANSKRFSLCMAKRAYETVCRKAASPEDMSGWLSNLATQFEETDGRNMRRLFERVSVDSRCLGGAQ